MGKESRINDGNFIVIQSFMVKELKLKGNELLIYACIYGFTQAEEQKFTGSLQYLADWTNSTKAGILKSLKSLIDKGLIIKNDKYINNVKFCEYYVTEFNEVLNKVEWGYTTKFNRGIKQSLPNNIDNNKTNNIDNIKKEKENLSKNERQTFKNCKADIETIDSVLATIENEDLKFNLQEFIKMRKAIKKPLTTYAFKLRLADLNKLSNNIDEQIQIVKNSVSSCWQDFYGLKKTKKEDESFGDMMARLIKQEEEKERVNED